jgi:hypothetical protein
MHVSQKDENNVNLNYLVTIKFRTEKYQQKSWTIFFHLPELSSKYTHDIKQITLYHFTIYYNN